MTPPDRLYSRKEAAEYLGLCLRTIDYLVKSGMLKSHRLASATGNRGKTKFDRRQLDHYVTGRTINSPSAVA